ncbi:DUF4913 domain-containing protein (plasmid) [Saccharopolyspora sp. ID03-671]|uniref:DUF4913 domain-containing protein n=1 Tax=Saccharopolyspora sp. ID03-671 TaxID=3073066 RepID=UPI0030F3B62D
MSTDEWDEALVADDEDTEADDQPEPLFPNVEAWVTEWFGPMMRRQFTGATCWCPEWWQHGEVISRLDALWRAWEALRLDASTGMSVWWRDHLDPHWSLLTDVDRSPMSLCSVDRGHKGEHEALPITPAPPGTWGTAG